MWYVDLELWCMYLLLAAAIGVVLWATVRSIRQHDKSDSDHHHVPARKIAIGTALFMVLCLLVCFLTGSTAPLISNGSKFDAAGWLRLSDMFINSSIVLIIVAALCVGYNWLKAQTRNDRKEHYAQTK